MREMKDSGVEWIGQIPTDWKIVRIKYVIEQSADGIKIGPFGSALSNKTISDGKYNVYSQANLISCDFSKTKNTIAEETYESLIAYRVVPGDICVSMMGTIGKCKKVPQKIGAGIMDSHLIKIRLSDNILPEYFEYIYDKDLGGICFQQMMYLKKGTIMDGLNTSIVKQLVLPLSDINTQRRIVDHLDRKCSQIDAIITRQQEVIEKLKAYKLSIITEAVTKGLNPDVPMKDSGVEWIGEIPEYWQLSHIGNLVEMGSGGTPDRKKPEYWENGNIPWMSSGEINDEYIYSTTEHITELGLQNSNAKILPVNTVMLGLIGQGKTKGLTAILKTEVCCNQNLAYLIADEKYLHYRYLFYCFKAMYFYIRGLVGESQAGIYSYFLKKLHIPLPDIEQQIRISDYLDAKCEAIKSSINKRERIIEKLTGYKKSLIYEVVTGKKEV